MNKTVLFCVLYICSGCASKRDNIPTPHIASQQASQRLVITTNQPKNQYDQAYLTKTLNKVESQIQQDASARKKKDWAQQEQTAIRNQMQIFSRNDKKVQAYYDANK